ncbi:hypothetical protein BJ165DRAFT_1418589 [Panaeolus papilionaceus]|nr:hypothetical protein BJ165DRAFT_1418589 [Panaeolus papilionaceus]
MSATDLGLDPSDPLNLLLHNSQNPEDNDAPQDWSKYSALWSDNVDPSLLMKQYTSASDIVDYTDLAMDMDFTPTIAIEPGALQFDPTLMKFAAMQQQQLNLNFGYEDYTSTMPPELHHSQFNFAFSSAALTPNSSFSSASSSSASDASPPAFSKERRLSITSASSSSGASLSPVPESTPSPAPGYASDVQPKEEAPSEQSATKTFADPAAELAHRVRQSAGVMLAVPMNGQMSGLVNVANIPSQPKLPIPRLPRHNPTIATPRGSPPSTSSSAASTPPPSTPPPSSAISTLSSSEPSSSQGNGAASAQPPAHNQPRPKTSHTTIERRYRTNLNARIQSLRMAVPALRVLEDRDGGNGKKIKKNVKGGIMVKGAGIGIIDSEDGSVVDIIDDRGFVDGVKVARKCSKANVLGKAVEYIRVLKKREMRLKAEQAGLKALVQGLVGGPALIREWEKEWKAKFGGEERDEVEGEDEEGDDEDSEDEEGEDDEEGGRKRKRAKVVSTGQKKVETGATVKKEKKSPSSSAASVVVVANEQGLTVAPEKRKRGRPRKVLPPPVTLAPVAGATQDQVMHDQTMMQGFPQQQWGQQSQPQQFLLAVFAVFSFFNSPLTSSFTSGSASSAHHHTGTVLSAHPPLAYSPEIVSQFITSAPSPSASAMNEDWAWKEYVQIFHLGVSLMVLVMVVANWFGFNLGMDRVAKGGRRMSAVGSFRAASVGRRRGGRENVDWIKLGEGMVLEDEATTLSLYERFRIYRSTLSKRNVSISDLTTLSLVLYNTTGPLSSFAKMMAKSLWADAANRASRAAPLPKVAVKVHEKLVLTSMGVDEAVERLAATGRAEREGAGERVWTPIEVVAVGLVKERVKRHLARLFVQEVDAHIDAQEEGDEKLEQEEVEWRESVDAAEELGGDVQELGRLFERVWRVPEASLILDDDEEEEEEEGRGVESEIQALVDALSLYRRAFPAPSAPCTPTVVSCDDISSGAEPLSPPPSPTPTIRKGEVWGDERAGVMRRLRKVMGRRVFEEGVGEVLELEDARDVVVDRIVEMERRERGVSL